MVNFHQYSLFKKPLPSCLVTDLREPMQGVYRGALSRSQKVFEGSKLYFPVQDPTV